MGYGVVACPNCRRAQLVELRFATVACRTCRTKFVLEGRRFFHRGDDETEARTALLKVSAQLQGMSIEDYSRMLASIEEGRRGTVDQVLEGLGDGREFTTDEFAEGLRRLRVQGTAALLLERLRGENRIYEPRPGRFRLL